MTLKPIIVKENVAVYVNFTVLRFSPGVASGCGTMVERSPPHPEVKGSRTAAAAAGTGRKQGFSHSVGLCSSHIHQASVLDYFFTSSVWFLQNKLECFLLANIFRPEAYP
jgi:hypothetical protein